MSGLPDYERAMDEVLAELGVERPPVTSAELFEAYTAPAVAEMEARQVAWGDTVAELFQPGAVVPFVDASTGEPLGQAMVIRADAEGISLLGDPLPDTGDPT